MNLLDIGYGIAAGVTAPVWARKTRGDWPARFGRTLPLPTTELPRIMVHAVSVGEVNALRELIPMLARDADVVVSVGTDTGITRARSLFGNLDACTVVRYPVDFTRCVRRFLDSVRPDAVALVELEVWPNFIRECDRRAIPVAVINGRLSERSFKGYRRARSFLRPTFARLARVGAQDLAYAKRFSEMGVADERVEITGSIKWDAATVADTVDGADQLARELAIDRSKPLIVAGSTGPVPRRSGATPADPAILCEEQILDLACPDGVQLLCAPRRPERFDEAFAALGGDERCTRRSAGPTDKPAGTVDRFLLDTIGELRAAYALADVVVIGRTFGKLHGSDPIEAAALGKPVVIGPDWANFASVVRTFIDADAIVQASHADLHATLAGLIADGETRRSIGGRACACVIANQGAAGRYADMLRSLVGVE